MASAPKPALSCASSGDDVRRATALLCVVLTACSPHHPVEAPLDGLKTGGAVMCAPSWPAQCQPRVRLAHPALRT